MTFTASQWQPTTYDNDTFKLDNYDFMVSSEYAYSFKYNPSTDTYRFEVRDGDQFTSTRFSDVAGSERSEISQSLRQSISGAANYTSAKWSFMIEPGQANTAKWMSLGQFHSGMNKSGPFDFGLRGDDKLSFVIRSGAGEKEIELPANVQRGHWYDIKVDLHFGPSGGGYVKVWLDGQQVVDYAGAVGYTDQSTTHWNMGIYRSSPAGGETIAYNVKGLDLSYGSSATAANHGAPTGTSTPIPAPAPTPEPTPAPVWSEPTTTDTINGTSGNDVLTGTNAANKIVGGDGNDIINGKLGSDALHGGAGADTFVFDTALGSTNVDSLMDFQSGVDKIQLVNSVFKSLWVQDLGTDVFKVGTAAADHNDHIIYNQTTGEIFYDADGNGSIAQVLFAKVKPGTVLSNKDFTTVASATQAPAPTAPSGGTSAPTPAPAGQTLTGTSSADNLTGSAGNDKIYGKAGNDVLTGGAGADTFVFDTALGSSNVDTIKDFTPGVDKIELSSKVFTALWVQELGTDVFRVGTKALDHNDHIIYDQATGTLSYDADGSGSIAAVQFAKVAAGLALSASDFYTI